MGAKTVLAIDPGPAQSAWVLYTPPMVMSLRLDENWRVMAVVEDYARGDAVGDFAIEMVASYGMPVGREVFETCVWIGRLLQIYESVSPSHERHYVYRKDVKLHLCGSMKAKDSNIRQALIDKFGPGREKAIGTKKAPGPLYGVKKDIWSALAVAVTWAETREEPNEDDDRKGDWRGGATDH